jgi:hypothetical protein
MGDNWDSLARDLASGLPTRRAIGRMAALAWTGFVAGFGTLRPVSGQSQSCYAPCRTKCTRNGKLDLTCYRDCVNSDSNNCGTCGNRCPDGVPCVGGKCTADTAASCADDLPTSASLEAAKLQLERGMLDVPLSPAGCTRYRRVLTAGVVTHEELLIGTRKVLIWDHTPNRSTEQRDADQDGFVERVRVIDRTAAGAFVRTETTEYSPVTQAIIWREVIVPVAAGLRVTQQQADNSGRLWLVANMIVSDGGFDQTASGSSATSVTGSNCSAAQLDAVKKALRHGMGVGLTCLQHYKDTGLSLEMMFHYVARDVVVHCTAIPPKPGEGIVGARLHNCGAGQPCPSFNDPSSPIEIDVNTNFFFGLDERDQASTMFHEMLHLNFGGHGGRPPEWDPVESCQALCFGAGSHPDGAMNPTQCSCATCLRTSKCDPRCKILPSCEQEGLGFLCPCPTGANAGRLFRTCSECLATCPSGLGCFGYSTCIPITQSGCDSTPVSCP